MIAILSGLDHLVLEEMLVEAMHRLFRTIVPACIDETASRLILECPVDLRRDGLGQVVGVGEVDPVTDSVQLATVDDAVRHGDSPIFGRKVGVRTLLLSLSKR